MSSRPFLKPTVVLENGNMSGDLTSEVTILTNLSMVSYAISWVGTSPLGECIIEVSNDFTKDAAGNTANPGTWNELPLSQQATVSGNSDNGTIEVSALAGYAIRLRYIRSSGSGTMQAVLASKVA